MLEMPSPELPIRIHPKFVTINRKYRPGIVSDDELLLEFMHLLAHVVADHDWQEYLETGEHRCFSTDPNVDWEAHDAKWAARDAEARLRDDKAAAGTLRKKDARGHKKAKPTRRVAAAEL